MIRDLIKNPIGPQTRQRLYKDKFICGCIFRSFNQLEANIFFRFTTNDGRLSKQELKDIYVQDYKDKRESVIKHFLQISLIITSKQSTYQLNMTFAKNVQNYLMDPQVLQPISQSQRTSKYLPDVIEPSPNSFLKILFEERKIPDNCKFKSLAGSNQYNSKLSKQQFNYIKSSISTKIGLLIEGILNVGNIQDNVRNIVKLNLLEPRSFYNRKQLPSIGRILEDLQKINLVKITGDNRQFFQISKYLHHYTFQQNQQGQQNQNQQSDSQDEQSGTNMLNKINHHHQKQQYCHVNIIIQTNFKVYTTVQSTNNQEISILRKILRYLLKGQFADTQFQEMIIGEIDQQFMRDYIFSQGISAQQYFDFFKQYMKNSNTTSNKPEKGKINQEEASRQLGKWRKLKFLGLDGPDEDSTIPSNVRQEVKLWNKLYQDKQYYDDPNT